MLQAVFCTRSRSRHSIGPCITAHRFPAFSYHIACHIVRASAERYATLHFIPYHAALRIHTGYLVQSVRHILFQQDNESYRIYTYRDKKRRCYWKSNGLRSHQPEKRIYQSRYPHHRNFTRYAVFTAPSSMQHTRKRQNGYINGELLIVWRNSGTRC